MTPKQARFVEEYLIDLNATQAAIRAGYSERTANEQAAQLLKRPEIIAAIDGAKDERSERMQIDADRVLAEIANMAFYDPADLMIDGEAGEDDAEPFVIDGRVIYGLRGPADIKRLPEKVRRVIIGWGWDRNQNFTVKLADKSKALDQLARHLSLYNDKLEVTSVDGLADRLERAKSHRVAADAAPVASTAPVPPVAPTAVSEPRRDPEPEPDPHPLHERMRRASEREASQPELKPDWQETAPQPAYSPILPAWPESSRVEVDYDPTGGAYSLDQPKR